MTVAKQKSTDTASSVPYVLQMPKNYDELNELFDSYTHNQWVWMVYYVMLFIRIIQGTIIDRLQTLYDVSLSADNRQLWTQLFTLILRYFDATSKTRCNNLDEFNDGACCVCVMIVILPIAVLSRLHALTICLYRVSHTQHVRGMSNHTARMMRQLLQHIIGAYESTKWPSFSALAVFNLVRD